MDTVHWDDLRSQKLRYGDAAWELTGQIEFREQGEIIAAVSRRADDIKRETATLVFVLEGSKDSPNPGNLDEQFVRLERTGADCVMVVSGDRDTFRYRLERREEG